MGIYGYSGDSAAQAVHFWHQALCFAGMETLLYYAAGPYRGMGISVEDVKKNGDKKDLAWLAGSMKRRPMDKAVKGPPPPSMKSQPMDEAVKGPPPLGATTEEALLVQRKQPIKKGANEEIKSKYQWWGWQVSVDAVGSYQPVAYGGLSAGVIAVDPFSDPPMGFFCDGGSKQIEEYEQKAG